MAERVTAAARLQRMHRDLDGSGLFRSEYLRQEISEMICLAIEREGVSKAELAARLGTSRAYVTKILQGTANFTLDSLCRISEALNCEFRLDLVPKRDASVWGRYRGTAAFVSEQRTSRPRWRHFSREAVPSPSVTGGAVDETLATAA